MIVFPPPGRRCLERRRRLKTQRVTVGSQGAWLPVGTETPSGSQSSTPEQVGVLLGQEHSGGPYGATLLGFVVQKRAAILGPR